MAATFMLAAGRLNPSGTDVHVDWRLAELLQWQEEEKRTLPLFADIIIWLENHGYMVNLISGEVQQLEPLQAYIEEAEDDMFLEVMQYHEDLDFDRRGGWL